MICKKSNYLGEFDRCSLYYERIFSGMPRLNASILLVQYMPTSINERVRASLNKLTERDVVIPKDRTKLEDGRGAKRCAHGSQEKPGHSSATRVTEIFRSHNF